MAQPAMTERLVFDDLDQAVAGLQERKGSWARSEFRLGARRRLLRVRAADRLREPLAQPLPDPLRPDRRRGRVEAARDRQRRGEPAAGVAFVEPVEHAAGKAERGQRENRVDGARPAPGAARRGEVVAAEGSIAPSLELEIDERRRGRRAP